MFQDSQAFSGFSIGDVAATRQFYGHTLGLKVTMAEGMEDFGILELHTSGNNEIVMYHKDDHQPASFTVLSFPVSNIDTVVDELTAKGVEMLQYGRSDTPQDDKGIMRGRSAGMGPDIAWFNDPSGNVLAVLQM